MADEDSVQNLCEETTCPICLEYFTDPVTIDCGHNFCRICIAQAWGKSDQGASCPQCREPCQQRNFRPNRQLASIVEIAKKFGLQMAKGAEALGKVCERHQEPLKLFCEDDQAPICVVCDKSKEHRKHKVIPKEEAFEEYQGKILSHLEFLNKQRGEILSSKLKGETESQNLLKQTDMERQKIMSDFKQLHQFLKEQERLLLAQLKELDDVIKDCKNQYIAKLCEEMASLDNLIRQLEEKQKQPATEFLQNMRSILERCNENENKTVDAIAFPPGLKERIDKFSKMHPFLEKETKKFKVVVLSGPQEKKQVAVQYFWNSSLDHQGLSLPRDTGRPQRCFQIGQPSPPPAVYTSSGDMAIPKLVLAAYGQGTAQATYSQPLFSGISVQQQQYNFTFSNNNISCCSYVMGVERITSGTHSWVVDVGNEKFWAVGVVKESLRQCDIAKLSDEIGIWAIGRISTGAYYASTHPGIFLGSSPSASTQPLTFNPKGFAQSFAFNLKGIAQPFTFSPEEIEQPFMLSPIGIQPKRIRVLVNYAAGLVTFRDADSNNVLFTFRASFSGEKICSFLCVGE